MAPQQHQNAITDEELGEPLLPPNKSTIPSSLPATPFHAYIVLLGAVVCLSSIGPTLDLQKGVDATMKVYWRTTGTYIVLFPFALRHVWKHGLFLLTPKQWLAFGLAAFCYATMCVCFVLALQFTSVGNAVIFSNCQSILLLVGKVVMGESISWMESLGALTAFAGAVFCSLDSSSHEGMVGHTSTLMSTWGDFLALLAAVGGVGYLVIARTLREQIPSVLVFMFMIMFESSFCVLMFLYANGTEFTFDTDIHHGLWGFLHWQPDRLPLEIWMVLICNIGGALGYIQAMAYFDNLVIAVSTLMEPVVATFMAYSLRVGLLPCPIGWFGNFLVIAGTMAVVYPSEQQQQGKQATPAATSSLRICGSCLPFQRTKSTGSAD